MLLTFREFYLDTDYYVGKVPTLSALTELESWCLPKNYLNLQEHEVRKGTFGDPDNDSKFCGITLSEYMEGEDLN